MQLPKIETTTKVARFLIGISTYWTVKEVIKNNVEPDKRRHEAAAQVGGVVVGKMVADSSQDWVEDKIRHAYIWWDDLKNKLGTT